MWKYQRVIHRTYSGWSAGLGIINMKHHRIHRLVGDLCTYWEKTNRSFEGFEGVFNTRGIGFYIFSKILFSGNGVERWSTSDGSSKSADLRLHRFAHWPHISIKTLWRSWNIGMRSPSILYYTCMVYLSCITRWNFPSDCQENSPGCPGETKQLAAAMADEWPVWHQCRALATYMLIFYLYANSHTHTVILVRTTSICVSFYLSGSSSAIATY